MNRVAVDVAGERLLLLADRAVYWPARSTLLVADTHFGKAASFRAAGLVVPGGTTLGALARLSMLLASTGAARVVFLGDFFHARQGRVPATLDALRDWRAEHSGVVMQLVPGNHDAHAGRPPPELGIEPGPTRLVEPPFVLAHHPEPDPAGYVLAGHLHPAAVLRGRGRQRERIACFWFGARVGVLPAFGEFTGLAEIAPAAADRVYGIAGAEVIALAGASG